jgi:hypothetical protein
MDARSAGILARALIGLVRVCMAEKKGKTGKKGN